MVNVKNIAGILVVLASLLQIQCTGQRGQDNTDELAPFFGTYKGSSINVAQGEVSERDLAVTFKPWDDNGFTVEWTAVTYRDDGEQKRAETSIDFYRSPRPGIFASAMRKDVFGNMVSYDPTGEDAAPYVWAGLEGETLTVRALYIIELGGYEIHTYKRSLKGGDLALDFERTRNGELVTQVVALLERIDR